MNFTALNTLPTFLRMLNPIFGNASNNRYSSDYYKNNEKQETSWGGNIISGHDNCIVGRYFEVKFNKVEERITQHGAGWVYGSMIQNKHPQSALVFERTKIGQVKRMNYLNQR